MTDIAFEGVGPHRKHTDVSVLEAIIHPVNKTDETHMTRLGHCWGTRFRLGFYQRYICNDDDDDDNNNNYYYYYYYYY